MRDALTPEQLVAEASTKVIPMIGQVSDLQRRALDKAVRAGIIAKWRGYWFPIAGASWGIGPLKTCYGPCAVRDLLNRSN
jgi:hypothetical protein